MTTTVAMMGDDGDDTILGATVGDDERPAVAGFGGRHL
jgi:hypothetical protein